MIRATPWLHGLVAGGLLAAGMTSAVDPTVLAVLALVSLPFIGIYHAIDIRARQGSRDRWLIDGTIGIRDRGGARTFVVDGREYSGEHAHAVVSHYSVARPVRQARNDLTRVHYYSVYFVVGETAHLLFETESYKEAYAAAQDLRAKLTLGPVREVSHEPLRQRTQTAPVVAAGLAELTVIASTMPLAFDLARWITPVGLVAWWTLAHLVIHQLLVLSQRSRANVVASELLTAVRVRVKEMNAEALADAEGDDDEEADEEAEEDEDEEEAAIDPPAARRRR
jgi:hypothetical protein